MRPLLVISPFHLLLSSPLDDARYGLPLRLNSHNEDFGRPSRINAARSAIGDSGEQQRLIKTLLRKGFRFVGAVREEHRQTATAEPAAAPALPDRPSIAVLPFTNTSGSAEHEYFADGIVEDIITELSRFSGLFVIARNSSFQWKGKSADIREVGRELGVRYVLEGSVRDRRIEESEQSAQACLEEPQRQDGVAAEDGG